MGLFSPPKLRTYRVPPPPPAESRPLVRNAAFPDWKYQLGYDDGSKWQGGFGPTRILWTDYWTLRQRSIDLFETNLYARGIIRRLVTNEINTGLHLEATPEERVLGLGKDALAEWSEDVETRFALWGNQARVCDYAEQSTFGALQVAAKMEALIAGDVLVVNRTDPRTGLPKIQLLSGSAVQSPMLGISADVRIDHGVERDAQGRHIAYWIAQRPANASGYGQTEYKRLPAYGEKSGRRLAWMIYGADKRLDDVRGKPLLALVLQSLKEIDRYRDSAQRKAFINSILALFIEKTQDKPGTKPITGGAIRRGTETTLASDNSRRSFAVAEQIPGMVLEELQTGESPKAFPSNGTDERFGGFEEAIIQAIAWANEIPPEILTLSFNSNYSASQAAINEFKIYLNKRRAEFGDAFCDPIYREWALAEVLAGRMQAPGLLESWRDPAAYMTFGAWLGADWTGNIKPAVDMSKLVRGYKEAMDEGLITRARAARELFGTRYSKNVQQLARENLELFHANTPLAELKAIEKTVPTLAGVEPSSPDDVNEESTDDADIAKPAKARTPIKAVA